jgi:hypothetical protein
MNPEDPNLRQINEQLRATTQMMKEMLNHIEIEAVDLQGGPGSEAARRFNCFGTFGTFGTLTGCFGTAGTFGCRSFNRAATPDSGGTVPPHDTEASR